MRTQTKSNGAVVRAISDRVLRQSDESALQTQSMEAMGRLAGGIAHVFNNLLTAISCEVELALTEMAPDEPGRKHLREIERSGERGAALARQLLAFSGRQVLQPKLVQLNNLLSGLEDRMRHILGDATELKFVFAPDLQRVQVDPGQLEGAILNLVSNARDAMPEGGRLTLETRNLEIGPGNPKHSLRSTPGQWVELEVSDTGPGMPEDVRKRVFEPFFSTKQGGEINGLGLSTAYGVVNQSGGQLHADSEPGKGSSFRIYLPSAEQPADADTPGVNGQPWETILLVDDEENVRRPLSQILTSRGYKVLEAADGAQAIEVSQRHAGPIHLMVTDILMGAMSGVELAERLSYDRAEMKVLFATGYPAGLAEGSGLEGEDANLIKKPFTGKDLAAKVREVLEGAD